MTNRCTFLRTAFLIAFFSATAGCASKQVRVSDPTELKAYVDSANRARREAKTEEGSLWLGHAYRSDLFSDPKARYIDDVLTIRVSESTQAVSQADAKNTKSTKMTAGLDKLFGAEKKINELPTLVSGKSDSSFQGQGSTSRATTLETSLTARVVDVLPNGYLVIEGMREVRVNNENQSIYLTGVVRPEDVAPNNVVLSSSVAQMQVRVQGKGVVSQPIKPGWLYRILNGILPF
jgi:flagellar L-ring protein precursor FlgH